MFASLRSHWSRSPVTLRVAAVVWTVLVLGVFGRVLASKPTSQSVMPIYLTAGERWIAESNLYDPVPNQDVYRNPPAVAAAFATLTPLPPKVASLLWRSLGIVLFLTGLVRLGRGLASDLTPTRWGIFFLLAAGLVLQAFNNAQVNLVLAAAILHGTAAALRERYWEAALWFGLGGWFKVYPLAAGMLVAVVHPWRFGPKLLTVAILAFLTPFFLAPSEYAAAQYIEYLREVAAEDRTRATLYRCSKDWSVISRVWFDATVQEGTVLAVDLLVGCLFAVLVGWSALTQIDRRIALSRALVLGAVWMTAFGPATEANTYAILAGPAAWVAVRAAGWARGFAWAGVGLLLATVFRGLFPQDWQFQALGPQALGAVLVGVAGLAVQKVEVPLGIVTWGRASGLSRLTRTGWKPVPTKEGVT